jgi:hypothetical protein
MWNRRYKLWVLLLGGLLWTSGTLWGQYTYKWQRDRKNWEPVHVKIDQGIKPLKVTFKPEFSTFHDVQINSPAHSEVYINEPRIPCIDTDLKITMNGSPVAIENGTFCRKLYYYNLGHFKATAHQTYEIELTLKESDYSKIKDPYLVVGVDSHYMVKGQLAPRQLLATMLQLFGVIFIVGFFLNFIKVRNREN